MSSTRKGTDSKKVNYKLEEVAGRFLSELQAEGRAQGTISGYRWVMKNLIACGFKDIRSISREQIAAHIDSILQKPVSHTYKVIWITRLKLFFQWAIECGLIVGDPTASLQLPAVRLFRHPPYLSQKEMAKLLESIPTSTSYSLRDRAMLETLYSTGLRRSEICRLKLTDINFADETVRVVQGKRRKDRIVPIGKTALAWIERYITEVQGVCPTGPLFCNLRTGGPLKNLGLLLSKYSEALPAGKRCFAHLFRHSFAVHLLENGASIRHIQAMLGHADLKTTQLYTHVVPTELRRAHEAAHPTHRRRIAEL